MDDIPSLVIPERRTNGVVRIELEIASCRDGADLAAEVAILVQREGLGSLLSFSGENDPLTRNRRPISVVRLQAAG